MGDKCVDVTPYEASITRLTNGLSRSSTVPALSQTSHWRTEHEEECGTTAPCCPALSAYFPKGVHHSGNNTSKFAAMSLGCRSWEPVAPVRTANHSSFGLPHRMRHSTFALPDSHTRGCQR